MTDRPIMLFDGPMKALSVRQPWTWCILHAGKDIENRDWQSTNPCLRFRGTCLLHASQSMTRAEYEDCEDFVQGKLLLPFLPTMAGLHRGGIVGVMDVVEIVDHHPSPWFMGQRGLVLANVRPLQFMPFKGALGFFDVPADVTARLRFPENVYRDYSASPADLKGWVRRDTHIDSLRPPEDETEAP